jgi:hypothetical protein
LLAHAGVLLALALTPSLAHAAAPKPVYSTARVEVDASELEGEGSTMEKSVASLSRNEVLRALSRDLAEHVTVVDKGAEAVVYVSLVWKDYETSHYGVRVEIRRGSTARLVVVDECKLCDEGKLAAKVAGRVEDLLPYLAVEPAEAATEPEVESEVKAEPETSEPWVEPEPVVDDGPGYRRVGVAGYVGIGALALGVGGVAGGIAVLLEDPTEGYVPNDDYQLERRDRVPLGGTLVGVGGALLVTGAVLVAVDQTILRRRRAERGRSIVLLPSVSPTTVGLGLTARF